MQTCIWFLKIMHSTFFNSWCCPQEAVAMIKSITDAEEAAKRLTNEAYQRGSSDNITCVVVRFAGARWQAAALARWLKRLGRIQRGAHGIWMTENPSKIFATMKNVSKNKYQILCHKLVLWEREAILLLSSNMAPPIKAHNNEEKAIRASLQ